MADNRLFGLNWLLLGKLLYVLVFFLVAIHGHPKRGSNSNHLNTANRIPQKIQEVSPKTKCAAVLKGFLSEKYRPFSPAGGWQTFVSPCLAPSRQAASCSTPRRTPREPPSASPPLSPCAPVNVSHMGQIRSLFTTSRSVSFRADIPGLHNVHLHCL